MRVHPSELSSGPPAWQIVAAAVLLFALVLIRFGSADSCLETAVVRGRGIAAESPTARESFAVQHAPAELDEAQEEHS